MKIITLSLLSVLLFFSGCLNKHGVSLKYYSDCKEYYDYQGTYHKECGEDDIISYEEMKDVIRKKKEVEKKGNVW